MPIHNNHFQKHIVAFFIVAAIAVVSIHARAAKQESSQIREAKVYIIKDGDCLGGIAMSQGVSVQDIIEANGLEDPDKIYSGMELMIPGAKMNSGEDAAPIRKPKPKKVIVEVPKGFTLTRIAKTYGVSVPAIVKANKSLKHADNLRAGMKLLIPGATEEIELVPPPPCFNPAVEFYRIRNDKTTHIHLTFCNGKPNPDGVEKLSHFTSPTNLDEMPFPLHPRLAVLLQKVADKYPGRRLEIVSGQRTQKRKNHESFHTKGQAIDFRVQGIPNRALVNFVRQFDDTGVGYYPNSVFIHMDTRKRNAFWIDYSRPGERAIYARAGLSDEELSQIRDARGEKKSVPKPRKNKHDAIHENIDDLVARIIASTNNDEDAEENRENNPSATAAKESSKDLTKSTHVEDVKANESESQASEMASIQGPGQV
ncbi:MAG: LysM peptidoglycan-binding domain-containing protein [Deltaproteobacteria bacterium]|nr:LysM peptidoglycan-binding domain-containing protein [Deltaproteobacteria bacterium]